MTGDERLTEFIRDTLGCQCSESVLAKSRVCSEPEAIAGVPLSLCIDVDHRLLVCVVRTDQPLALVDSLQAVFDAGKSMRDRGGYNRFRFVVGVPSVGTVYETFMTAFSNLSGLDDRLHLHVVDAADIPDGQA